MIASELVSNPVRHAGTSVTVTAIHSGHYLHVRVKDADLTEPRPRDTAIDPGTELSERGRGLSLVNAYATTWGSVSTATGKTVWATIRTTPLGLRAQADDVDR